MIRLALVAALALLPQVATATLVSEVARLATPLVDASGLDTNRAVGLAVVVVTREGNRVFGFGAPRAGGTNAPDGNTYFQIGSVTKVLTGLMLASLVEDSATAINPDAPANSYLAADLRVPAYQGQPVTLTHLATHHGSLPDMPDNLTGTPTSPALNYSRTQLSNYLAGLTLQAPPGSTYRYSNLGFGLLGLALADVSGAGSYSALLQFRLTGPLGMTNTGLNETAFVSQIGTRLAQGYRMSGGALIEIGLSDMGVLEAGGEVISTANDIGKFVRAFTGLAPFPVTNAVARAVAPVTTGAPGDDIGYGWDIVSLPEGVTQYEKAGAVAGYTCFVAFRREPAVGVAVLSNRGQHQAILSLARQIVALLPPTTLNVQSAATNAVNMSFPANALQSYELQASSNLANWTSIAMLTNTASTNATLTALLPATNLPGFFRVRY